MKAEAGGVCGPHNIRTLVILGEAQVTNKNSGHRLGIPGRQDKEHVAKREDRKAIKLVPLILL